MQERKSLSLEQFPREIQRAIMRFKPPRRGRRGYSEATIQSTVYGIGHYLAVVQNVGLPLETSHEGLSVFIDSLDTRALRSSTRLMYLTAVQAVAKEVKYPAEKHRLILEDCEIYRSAMKKEIPTKVRKLAANPISLRDISKAAVEWRKIAQEATNVNRRRTYFQRSAFLALMSLTPLRLRDVNALEIGTHVMRNNANWVMSIASSKTQFQHNGPLYHSLKPFLDDLLLYGKKDLCHMLYTERLGTRLFANHIDDTNCFTTAGVNVGHPTSPIG